MHRLLRYVRSHYPDLLTHLTFIAVTAIIFTGLFLPRYYHVKQTPPGTEYSFAEGFTFDYFQYMSYIKYGMEGNWRLVSRYTDLIQPKVLIHTYWTVLGHIASAFSLSPFAIYLISKMAGTILLIFSIYQLIRIVLPQSSLRILALILMLAMTGIWNAKFTGGVIQLSQPLDWSTNFNILGKFALPPHHLYALSALIWSFILLFRKNASQITLLSACILGMITGFLNPSTVAITIFFSIVAGLIFIILYRKKSAVWLTRLGVMFLFILPVLGYHYFIFNNMFPWSYMYKLMYGFNPVTHFWEYLFALGPILILALPSVFSKRFREMPLIPLLFSWAFAPLALYPFTGWLPINNSRLFQSYQYIPLIVLAPLGLSAITGKFIRKNLLRYAVYIVISLAFTAYAVIPFIATYQTTVAAAKLYYFNMYVPYAGIHALQYLDTTTPYESVVLAGEYVSAMIPAYTHNRTVIGREDTVTDYFIRRKNTFDFFDGKLTADQALSFFRQYNISYIFMGMDAPMYGPNHIEKYPFLKVVFSEGPVSILRIIR